MATTPIERLLFLQGNRCFFCQQPLAKADASVEHLLATANGGNNHDGNCVACCKAVNRLLGSLQLKDKFKVVLNQRGTFVCPDVHKRHAAAAPAQPRPPRPQANPHYDRVLENLRKRSNSRPRTLERLKSSVLALLPKGTSVAEVDALLTRLKTDGIVTVNGAKVAYQLK
jgi:hypothetical protein